MLWPGEGAGAGDRGHVWCWMRKSLEADRRLALSSKHTRLGLALDKGWRGDGKAAWAGQDHGLHGTMASFLGHGELQDMGQEPKLHSSCPVSSVAVGRGVTVG